MKLLKNYQNLLLLVCISITACTNNTNKKATDFISAKEAVVLNQLIYKDSLPSELVKYNLPYKVVFAPKAVNGNYAVIVKENNSNKYAVVIRGSVLEFNNDGFQNFILQDFNIFTMRQWQYADTVKGAYISNGAAIGLANILALKDSTTGLNIAAYTEKNIPKDASLLITGHSLGGNLAYVMAGYLHKKLPATFQKRVQLITYGAPAVGNAAFVQDMEQKFPTAERYANDRDIACVFQDVSKLKEVSTILGLDSAMQIGKLGINGVDKLVNIKDAISIVNDVLEKTNVLNESNKYAQSTLHLRKLTSKETNATIKDFSVDKLFGNAYQYHSIHSYAKALGGNVMQ